MTRRGAVLGWCLVAVACGGSKKPVPPLERPILGTDLAAAAAANASVLPTGFVGPQETACGPDTTRPFLGELADHFILDSRVPFHWAPVVPGPIVSKGPVAQPELTVSGTIVSTDHSPLDTSFDHPFGFDLDLNIDVDAPFRGLVKNRDIETTELHAEIETGLFPEAAFGFAPRPGDRVLLRGAWIFDCGHPPYETELHPPTAVSFARALDEKTTDAVALAVPWRVTQLFGPVQAVSDFGDPQRLASTGTPFPDAFVQDVLSAAAMGRDHLEAHALLEELRFGTFSFSVCAPAPRPANAALRWTHRFAVRTGVTVQAAVREDQGCVDYTATMTSAHVPALPARQDLAWPWADINAQASGESGVTVDVRKTIADGLSSLGFGTEVPAVRADHPPVIDHYAPLVPRADVTQASPLGVVTADDQPYPFAGRVRVSWE